MTRYFDRFKSLRVNAELSKGKITKHEELEKAERNDGKNTNPEKVAEEKFLAIAPLECANLVRYKTLWSSLRSNYLTGADHYQKTLNY